MRIISVLVLSVLSVSNVWAAAPTPESIEKLLVVTRSESMLSSMYGQIESMMRQSMQQAIQDKSGGAPLTAKDEQAIEKLSTRLSALIVEELSWAKMKPGFTQIYAEAFDQKEINDLVAFYESPSGQAMINKMPVVMQKSMAMTQKMMGDFMPKMQKTIQDSVAELKAAE